MDGSREGSLGERVERLEREVEELGREVRSALRAVEGGIPHRELYEGSREVGVQASAAGSRPESGGDQDFSELTTSRGRGRFRLPFNMRGLGDLRSGEWWLNKLGIGLLVFGFAFLFV